VGAQPGTPLGLRNRAILLAGFGGALRRSEIVALNIGDVELIDGRGVVLTVRRSKTDQYGAGQAVAIWRSDGFCQVSRQPTRCSGSSTSMRYQSLWF
jgi:site-specific recombinase XerC